MGILQKMKWIQIYLILILILTFLSVIEAILVQEVAGAIGIPNMDAFVSKFLSVGAALNEPEQLLNNTAPKHTLRSQQGEAWWRKTRKITTD